MGWGMDVIGGLVEGAQDVGGAIVDGVQTAASATVEGFESAASWVRDQLTPDIRPEGTNGHQIYVWFHHGPGTGSLDNAVDGWRKVSEHHVAVADAVNSAMGKLRTSWDGQAAGSAIDASRPLRDAADTASQSARQAGDALAAQSFGFNETKKSVVEVPADPPMLNPLAGGIGAVNYYNQAQSYTADQQANQACLQTYGTQTGANSGDVPRFDRTGDDAKRGEVAQPKPVAPIGGGFQDPGGSGTYSGGSSDGSGTSGGSSGMDGTGSRQGGHGGTAGTSGGRGGGPAGTGSSWYDGDGGLPQGGGFDYSASHGVSGAGVAAGAAGLVAGGGAVLGGGVLGDRTGGRGGISGRGIAGFGSGSGSGTGAGGRTPGTGGPGAGGPGAGGRSGGSPLGGRPGGVTPTTGGAATATTSRAGAPMAAGATGRGQRGEEDEQHERPEWLTADESPDELFGTSERTAPPVLGALPSEQDDQR